MVRTILVCGLASAVALTSAWADPGSVGLPTWRGPTQVGTFPTGPSVDAVTPDAPAWTLEVSSRGTPVRSPDGATVYVFGYVGEGPALFEGLWAVDVATGEIRWKQVWRDFLSDIIYDRYSIGAPTVDPFTGHVYVQSSNGVLMAFTADGAPLWDVSMMEAYGRLTFPNGRTGAPVVVGDTVIVHGITAFWGKSGPARDRFFAFDKTTGELVWQATPGTAPKDSSFSTPFVEVRDGTAALYAGTGCGHVVAVDARTGDPLWRHRLSVGGVNVSPVVAGDLLVAAHAKENLGSTRIGKVVALDLSVPPGPAADDGVPIRDSVRWTRDLAVFSSSPVVDDEAVYLVTITGDLHALDLATGEDRWHLKLGPDQLHASPMLADGVLWVPLRDGSLHAIAAGADGGTVLGRWTLPGTALGAPTAIGGRMVIATTDGVYAFGELGAVTPVALTAAATSDDAATRLRVRPAELLLRPGGAVRLTGDLLTADGRVVRSVPIETAETFVPPTAKVAARMDAVFGDGGIVASDAAQLSAGAWRATAQGLTGTTRGRIVAPLPYSEDFEAFTLEDDFAYPPLPWIGARFKWEVREVDGDKALSKTLDRMIFQRSTVFVGHPDEARYEVSAAVKSDGDRRMVSSVGLVNSRYLVVLKGGQRVLEVSSNQERLKQSVPFVLEPGVWYRLRTQVIPGDDGTTTVRAKAWKTDDAEPEAWTLTVEHADGHTHGAPGLFGFSPRNLHAVYVDDLTVTPLPETP